MTKLLLRGAALLSLPLLCVACKTCEPVVRTETVEVKVPVLVRLDPKLTARPAEPRLKAGPVTNDDLANLIDELRAWGRGLAGKLAKIEGLQPKEAP
ncbi:hypothetical protein [Luteibacter sp.]|uniref:hypothetical protein n=1 Tax=Luteibacter sp. TaxID=1886636 RepID=UPI002806CFED|nr:hypothetical protein [Luteibacter sp.]MDQ8050708.1 hypothetical protein [Luteibacter sp.]